MPAPRRSLFSAIKEHLPNFEPEVVFDVGANVGQSAVEFLSAFPGATIYAFEPVRESFEALLGNARPHERIRPFNLALGAAGGTAHMTGRGNSLCRRIVEDAGFLRRQRLEEVPIETGGKFCAEHGVDRIGFLKVDTEGHDLKVVQGFAQMLAETRIDLVEAEVGMNPENRRHVPFEAVKEYLEGQGYRLFHLYQLAIDVPFSGRPVLRRGNAVFASSRMIESNLWAKTKADGR